MANVSDHYAIYNSFLTENREVSGFLEIKRRLNSRDQIAALNTALAEVDWSGVMSHQSAEQAYNEFITKITDNYNFHCPLVTHKVKKLDLAKPYITNDLKLAIKEKHRLQKLYNKWPITYAEQYKRFRNSLTSKLRTAKSNYIRNKLISTGADGCKESWNVLNCVLGRNKFEDSSSQFLINGELTNNSLEIVEGFNEHFSSLGDNLAAAFLPGDDGYLQYLNDDFEHLSFNFEPTNPEEVTRLVLTMKEASPGWDGVPMKVLKNNITSLAGVISHICNLSMSTGVFPENLMIAVIIFLFKSGDPKLLPNYRAISILSAFSKIIEKLVSIRLVSYFNENNMFSSSQFGFRSGLSTEDAVQKVVTSLYAAFDAGRPAVSVFLDLAKAFDTVDREKLYRKLYHYGVRGTPLNWFKSYFSARKQCVSYKGVRSAMRSVGCGVAQGSVLGPILFLIYINDLPRCSVDLEFVIYADDTTVFFSSDNLDNTVNVINVELGRVSRWISSNSLTVI